MQNAAYDQIGVNYAPKKRPDPRLARLLRAALGSVSSVVNVRAGTGSYELGLELVPRAEPWLDFVEGAIGKAWATIPSFN